mmetsp:Transcript_30761/g.56076  ORF Transcript_30761/g.56076 Transcript_30761/m.56076 type:complete len:227 (+) Transcript_30761:37-717(+)
MAPLETETEVAEEASKRLCTAAAKAGEEAAQPGDKAVTFANDPQLAESAEKDDERAIFEAVAAEAGASVPSTSKPPEKAAGEDSGQASPDSAVVSTSVSPESGPPIVTVQFKWGVETFTQTDIIECERFVYRSRGSLDGRGGLKLSYSAPVDGATTGCWQLGSPSGGVLYRIENDGMTPAALLGNLPWKRAYGGVVHITVMRKTEEAQESAGWIDPPLLAGDKDGW